MRNDPPRINGALLTSPLLSCCELLISAIEGGYLKKFEPDEKRQFAAMITTVTALRTAAAYFRAGVFLVADESRNSDGWTSEFKLTLSLQARTILEIFFNLAFLFEEPVGRFPQFTRHGWRETALELDLYREEYLAQGGEGKEWIDTCYRGLEVGRHLLDISDADAADPQSRLKAWLSPGKMWCYGLNEKTPSASLPPTRRLLKKLYFEYYKPLSGEVHGNGYGQVRMASLLIPKRRMTESERMTADLGDEARRGALFSQTSLFFLCCLCEVHQQVTSERAFLGVRLALIWSELIKVEALKEAYMLRYEQLYPLAAEAW